jgi:hydroxyacylglutathione hydrolase
VFFVPGHTSGHIAYAFREQKALFCGDTLFALGCGRLFEGTPQQMWTSLSRLRALPDDMKVYCAHEYTQSNARFALTVETDNDTLIKRSAAIDAARAKGEATVPSLLSEEKATNPFLRADVPAARASRSARAAAVRRRAAAASLWRSRRSSCWCWRCRGCTCTATCPCCRSETCRASDCRRP